MKFELVSAPKNPYKKPKGVKNKTFKLGDIVITPEGNIGAVIEIQEGYRDRADDWHNKPVYHLNLDYLPGSPRVGFMGWELNKVDVMALKSFVERVAKSRLPLTAKITIEAIKLLAQLSASATAADARESEGRRVKVSEKTYSLFARREGMKGFKRIVAGETFDECKKEEQALDKEWIQRSIRIEPCNYPLVSSKLFGWAMDDVLSEH